MFFWPLGSGLRTPQLSSLLLTHDLQLKLSRDRIVNMCEMGRRERRGVEQWGNSDNLLTCLYIFKLISLCVCVMAHV